MQIFGEGDSRNRQHHPVAVAKAAGKEQHEHDPISYASRSLRPVRATRPGIHSSTAISDQVGQFFELRLGKIYQR